MATKINDKLLKSLAKVGITGIKTEEKATETILKKLKEHEVEGVEDENLQSLIEMYEAFYAVEETEEEEEATEEEENEELAEEVEEEEEAEEVEEEEETTDRTKKKIVTPAKKTSSVPKRVAAVGEAWDGHNKEHVAMIEPFKKLFKGKEVEVRVRKTGFSILALLKSTKKVVISYDNLRIVEDALLGTVFFNVFKGTEEMEKYVQTDLEIKNYNNNLCFIPKVTEEQALELLNKELIDKMWKKMDVMDKRLSTNKAKLEEKMATDSKKPAAKAKSKAAEEETEEEVEEAAEPGLDDMDRTALKKHIKANNLEVIVKTSMSDDDIRNAIIEATTPAEAEEEEAEEEEEVEEVEEVKPVAKKKIVLAKKK